MSLSDRQICTICAWGQSLDGMERPARRSDFSKRFVANLPCLSVDKITGCYRVD